MNTNKQFITISGIDVQIIRKDIRNVHLSVYPPDGNVRISVPLHITNDNVRLAVISKLSWIKKQQACFDLQARQSKREMVSGESHYFLGKRYRMELLERRGKHEIKFKNNTTLQLLVNPNTSIPNRNKVIQDWYRAELKERVPGLIQKWEPVIGVAKADWRIKKMKTKWGSCNIRDSRIWVNLELAKKSFECLEYIVVHEMVHLLERHHNDVFRAYMDKFLPNWRSRRDLLNQAPLAYEDWKY